MRFVKLAAPTSYRETISVFGGFNAATRPRAGEFAAMENFSSDQYPLAATRPGRGAYASPKNPQGLIARDSLCWVDGSKFVMNGYCVEMNLSEREEDCPKRLVSMGAYVVIFPDKKYINTLNLDVLAFIDHNITVNVIKDGKIVDKKELILPREIKNVIKCRNPRCITSIEQELPHVFVLADEEKEIYRCKYCEEKAGKSASAW